MSNNRILGNLATYIDSASNGGAITKVGNDFSIQAMTDSDVGGTPTTGFAGTDSASVKGLITTADIVQKSKQVKDAPGFKNIIQGNISKLNPSVTATYNIGDSSNPIDEIILDSSATIFFGAISLTSALKSGTSAIAVAAAAAASPVAGSAETSFLLKTDSTQTDAQADVSTNAFTITESGNVKSTALSPYHPKGYSTYFDGTGDYITFPSNSGAPFDFGTDNFTIEGWFYLTTSGSWTSYWGISQGGGASQKINLYDASGDGTLDVDVNGSVVFSSSAVLSDLQNKWAHIALVREGTGSNQTKLYVNGSVVGQGTVSTNFSGFSQPFTIGHNGEIYSGGFYGYISDFRVVSSAVYTTTFTPPTERLTAISGTQLLTCHLPYLVDGSSNGFSVTVSGNTKTELFSPYDHVAYSPSDHGGSVYFDGDGDYLTVASSSNLGFSADFTVEFWLYYTGGNGYKFFWTNNAGSGDYLGYGLNTGSLNPWLWNDANVITTSTAISTNTWQHHAVVRNGSTLTIYLDGVSIGSTTNTTTFGAGSQPFYIGWNGINNQQNTTGYISDMRVVNGSAIYTTDFTPPTEPLTAITNTQLLTCTNKNSLWDAGSGTLLTVNGDTTTSTSQTKYASSSVYFDGTGDYINVADYEPQGNGDFTWEAWIYASSANDSPVWESRYPSDQANGFTVTAFSSTVIRVFTSSLLVSATVSNYLNSWTHVAFTKSGTTNRLFINGTLEATATASNNFTNTSALIGAGRYSSSTNITHYFDGYIEDVRVTNSLARYTADFTPPTAALEG